MKKRTIMYALLLLIVLSGCIAQKQEKNRKATLQTTQSANAALEEQLEKWTKRKAEEISQGQRTTLLDQQGVPSSQTKLEIPISDLLDLPGNAGYSAKEGQASVKVEKEGANLIVTSFCDSIARRLLLYEVQSYRYKNKIDSLSEENESLKREIREQSEREEMIQDVKKKPPLPWYKWVFIGFLLGLPFPVRKLWTQFKNKFK